MFFLCRFRFKGMAKTKMTKRSGTRKCPMCSSVFHGDVEFSTHVVECAMKEHSCDFCDFTSQKECNVRRHMKRAHTGLTESPIALGQKLVETDEVPEKAKNTENANNIVSSEDESEDEEWLSQDPGDLLPTETTSSSTTCASDGNKIKETVNKEISDLMVGRVFRKKTTPSLPGKRTSTDDVGKPPESIRTCGENACQTKKAKIDGSTQTEFRREISVKTVRKYREGEVDIKETTTEQLILF